MSAAQMKDLAKAVITVLVVMAVVNRVPKLKAIIG
jgi:hypothetical protein